MAEIVEIMKKVRTGDLTEDEALLIKEVLDKVSNRIMAFRGILKDWRDYLKQIGKLNKGYDDKVFEWFSQQDEGLRAVAKVWKEIFKDGIYDYFSKDKTEA